MYLYILVTLPIFIVCNAAPLVEERNLYEYDAGGPVYGLPGNRPSFYSCREIVAYKCFGRKEGTSQSSAVAKYLCIKFEKDIASTDGEFGEYFEGDMLLTSTQMQQIQTAETARNGLRGGANRWPDKTVVYHIDEDDFDEEQIKMIEEGIKDIANKSCIKFRPRKNDEHAVTIQGSANGCFSSVGFSTEQEDGEEHQVLNLAKGCFKHGTIVHEMLHTLGFYHMQSTYDRDDFVEIVWENIKAGTEHNFAKYTNDTVTDFGVKYDYDSVMHYPEHAFTKNGNRTIIPLQANVTIGQRNGLSEKDILKLNKMYCEGNEETTK